MLTSLKSLDHDELLSLAESSNSMDTLIDIVEFSILHGDNELVRKVVANPHVTHDLFHHTISIGYAYRNAFAHGSQDEYVLHHLIDIGVHSNCFVTNPYIPPSVAKRVANTERDIEKVGMYTKNYETLEYIVGKFRKVFSVDCFIAMCKNPLMDSRLIVSLIDSAKNPSEKRVIIAAIDKSLVDCLLDRDYDDMLTSIIIERSDNQDYINSFQNSSSQKIIKSVVSKTNDSSFLRKKMYADDGRYIKVIASRKITDVDIIIDYATTAQGSEYVRSLLPWCKEHPDVVEAIVNNVNIDESLRVKAQEIAKK